MCLLAASDRIGLAAHSHVEGQAVPVSIAIEENALHYAAREVGPGPMHSDTKAAMLQAEVP
jgi:hypothetical protein